MSPEGSTLIAIAALFGLITGSFLNVCIYRLPIDLTPWRPARSFCPSCEYPIAWYDNIPLLSFLILHGRCRHCGARVSFRYPLVELTMGLVFAYIAAHWGLRLEALKWALLSSLLTTLFWTDLENRLLPDEFTVGGTLAGMVLSTFLPPVSFIPGFLMGSLLPQPTGRTESVLAAAGSAILLALPIWLLGWLYSKIRGREGLGLGDIKLAMLIAVFFGLEHGISILLVASVTGSLTGLTLVFLRRVDPKVFGLPFGSFIAASGLLAMLGAI